MTMSNNNDPAFDFDTDVSSNVNTNIDFDTDIDFDKDFNVCIDVDSDVDIEGNLATLTLDAEAIGRAERLRGALYRDVARFFRKYDLLLCAAACVPPRSGR